MGILQRNVVGSWAQLLWGPVAPGFLNTVFNMKLLRLKAADFRNLKSVNIEPSPDFNLLFGNNGSGKTSVLETIYFLGLGRSFRSNLTSRIISYEQESLSVFGQIAGEDGIPLSVGIEKKRSGKARIKVGNEIVASLAELARSLPLQIINPDSYSLLNEGPRPRREFINWGVFHVEHSFFPLWQRYQRALKQRNSSLQQRKTPIQTKAWDFELASTAEEIAGMRETYLQQLTPVFFEILGEMFQVQNLGISYSRGWDADRNLQEVLESSFSRDAALGYTHQGPHRADLIIKINNVPVQDILSRGEQKLLVIALRLAQGTLLRKLTSKKCIYLLDDIAAELDLARRGLVFQMLSTLGSQVFVTAVEREVLGGLARQEGSKMFHVEHGEVSVA